MAKDSKRMIIFTEHSKIKLKQRGISEEKVRQTIRLPDEICHSLGGRKSAFKKFGRLYLKVVFKEEKGVTVVITEHFVEKI